MPIRPLRVWIRSPGDSFMIAFPVVSPDEPLSVGAWLRLWRSPLGTRVRRRIQHEREVDRVSQIWDSPWHWLGVGRIRLLEFEFGGPSRG